MLHWKFKKQKKIPIISFKYWRNLFSFLKLASSLAYFGYTQIATSYEMTNANYIIALICQNVHIQISYLISRELEIGLFRTLLYFTVNKKCMQTLFAPNSGDTSTLFVKRPGRLPRIYVSVPLSESVPKACSKSALKK